MLLATYDILLVQYYQQNQWPNWTSLYGLDGTDGMLRYRVYEGRGNHDGGNSTDQLEPHFVASEIVARNQLRLGLPEFNITAISETGLHYAWTWPVSDTCTLHFVMMNEYAGHICEGCAPNNCFYGPACYTGWTYPEDSLGFLESYLTKHVNSSGQPVMVAQHYGFDGYSNTWYSVGQRQELYDTLIQYNTVGIWVGHTHAAAVYQWNGTDTIGPKLPGGLDVYNIPSTQKEDDYGNAMPSEFMVAEMSIEGSSGQGTLKVGQRVGFGGWGQVMAMKNFACP